MKVSLIGGMGFIGTRLAKRLIDANETFSIYDIRADEHEGKLSGAVYVDVAKLETLNCIDSCDAIVNLAAVHRDDVRPLSRYDEVNVDGARNVCEIAEQKGINMIVFTSSVAIYGFAPADTGEDGKVNYFNDYGRTKWLAEGILKEWQQRDASRRTLVIVRPTVVFGEGNRGNVYNLLKQIQSGRFVMFGSGRNFKSMAYVENVAAFLQHSLKLGVGVHIYNFVDKPDFNMNQLVSTVRKILFGKDGVGIRLPAHIGIGVGYVADLASRILGISLPVSSIRVKKFMGTTQFSTAVSRTGFVAPISLGEGLARTVTYEFLEKNSSKRVFITE
jgi:GlcNAc-P-P-Und epimerase